MKNNIQVDFSDKYRPANTKLADKALFYFNSNYTPDKFEPFEMAKSFVQQEDVKPTNEGDYNLGLPVVLIEDLYINKQLVSDTTYSIYNDFSGFINYIKRIVLDNYTSAYKGLERIDIPPMEAYDKIGHNKLGVVESAQSHAALYDL